MAVSYLSSLHWPPGWASPVSFGESLWSCAPSAASRAPLRLQCGCLSLRAVNRVAAAVALLERLRVEPISTQHPWLCNALQIVVPRTTKKTQLRCQFCLQSFCAAHPAKNRDARGIKEVAGQAGKLVPISRNSRPRS
ncbi:hypothetical protein NDU88_000458 [Pleurodeles waltl]|uniref:Uncharacterized protein n=1 Tax=Pleurodeles waltl TaxID=8319 RepID=A0AAV7P0X7_PLEWA|nr:hypothetical protein NDU88_000458 [Pleurodeles waltl]